MNIVWLWFVAAIVQYPAGQHPSQTRLVEEARRRPDSVRQSLTNALAAASTARSNLDKTQLLKARRLADAYSKAWNDPFFARQVVRFESLSSRQRRVRVEADSLRRAGNDALGAEGVPAAMLLWRESLRRASLIADPAAVAPALLSIGAGFYRFARYDSAEVYLKRAHAMAVRIGDRRTAGNATGLLASVRKDQGRLDEAVELYSQAARVRALSGDTRGIAADENNLGLIALERGDPAEAAAAYERALAINRRENRPAMVALNVSNLAGIAVGNGEYLRAESLYREALTLQARSENFAELAFVRHGLGKLYVSRGDYRKAEAELREAVRLHDETGARMDAVAARIDLAAVLSAVGDPLNARRVIQQAGAAAEGARAAPSEKAALSLALGDLAIHFGTFADAETEYTRAVRLGETAGDQSLIARGLEGKGLLLHWRGNNSASLSALREAVRLHEAQGDRRAAALAQLTIGDVETAAGNLVVARNTLNSARATLRSLGDAVGEAAAFAALGAVSLREGSTDRAAASYRAGLARLGSREASQIRWRLHTGYAEVLRSRGSLAQAGNELRTAIATVEKTAGVMELGERRSGFLADKWSAYAQLALIEQARGRAGEAFAVSERMRARQTMDMLARGRVPRTARASAQEQDLRRRIGLLTQRLEVSDPSEPRSRDRSLTERLANATRVELAAAEREYARLLTSIRETDPEYHAIAAPTSRSWKDIASSLERDEVFLEYLLTDSASLVFAVTADTVAAIDLGMNRQSLTDLADFSRKAINQPEFAGARDLWRAPLRRLYSALVQPVADEGLLRGKRRLIIAPHGELHFLSFASFIEPGRSDRFLIDRYEIAYTPSATVWIELGQRRLRSARDGVLALAPNAIRLPGSRSEAVAIGRIHGRNSLVRLGPAATSQALRAALPRVGIVHLATFGVLNRQNPLFSFIELAPSEGDDGRLEVNEVFGLSFSGHLVVLSACETGLGSGALADVPPGDDWIGLVQAFLHAGARGVVASLWPVEDRATSELMEFFHQRLATGAGPVAGLAEAQRALIRNPRTAAPRYWAGFIASGRSE
ncbi:MAG: CHAT domain-containing tetratricopeptide repeat protein [Gemmatimonadaceae bacterium]